MTILMLCGINATAKKTGMYLFFDLPQNHIYEDSIIKLVIAFEGNAKLVLYNKTDNVIYVDKENTFAYINNVPENLFKNSVQTVSHSNNTGASVNLGSVAGALGISGPLGTLANGINVGGGSGNTSGTMTYEKRILSVAPKSTAFLYEWNPVEDLFKTNYCMSTGSIGENGYFNYPHKEKFKKGMVRNFPPTGSPLHYNAIVRYSITENFSAYTQAQTDNYLAHIVIDSYKGVKKGPQYRTISNAYCNNLPYVATVVGMGDWLSWFLLGSGIVLTVEGLLIANVIPLK